MGRVCTVCAHDEHHSINVALVQRTAYRNIAHVYGVSQYALMRHAREHLPKLLVQSSRAVEVARADDLIGTIEGMIGRLEAFIDRAEAAGDGQEFRAHAAEWRKQIELLAKISGELRQEGITNVFVNPQWVQLEATIVNALVGFPEAREAVLTAIEEEASSNGKS
jgi:hypothetical protein